MFLCESNCWNTNFKEHRERGRDIVQMLSHLGTEIVQIPLHGGIFELP